MANTAGNKKRTSAPRVRYVSEKYSQFDASVLTAATNSDPVPGTEIANIVANLQTSLQKLESVVAQMHTRLTEGGVLQDETPSLDADSKSVKYASSPLGGQLEDLDLCIHASIGRINDMTLRLAV